MTTTEKPKIPFFVLVIAGCLFFLCIFSAISNYTKPQNSPQSAPPTDIPNLIKTAAAAATQNVLYTPQRYASRTPRQFPTSINARALPTHAIPTSISTSIPSSPIPTDTIIILTPYQPPSDTATPAATQITTQPTQTPALTILEVNKQAEYVIIKNTGPTPVDLTGWILLSEKGNQDCPLGGTIQPGATLQIWAQTGTGFSCNINKPIWNNTEPDPAVLLDPQGREVSRY